MAVSATKDNAKTAMITIKVFNGRVIELGFMFEEGVGVGAGVGVEKVKGIFGGKVTVCVLLHPLVSPKNTYG